MFEFIPRFFKQRFGVDKEYFRFIDEMFGFVPNNIELYKVALIHKSASQSIGGHSINNERLEYLGDAIIESITSDYLFIEFPDCNEGFLTQMRAKLVSRQSLNEIARKIGLDRYVIYNMNGNFAHKHIYGDAFEAMIGAIYLDKGYEFVNRLLINKIYAECMNLEELTASECDFKSRLIEWCQKNHHKVAFRTRTVNARRSAPTFYTTVLIDGIEVGHGSGDSKKEAEQSAASSVSHQMSDEECAYLLDKFDNLHNKIANEGSDGEQSENAERSRSSRSRRRRRRRSAAAENVENSNAAQQHDTATVAAESEPHKEVKTERITSKKQSAADSKPAAEQKIAAEEQPAEEKPKRTRAPRRRKAADASAVNETITEVAAQTPADAATEKKPTRRKRAPKKPEANAVSADMQQPISGNAASKPATTEAATKAPAKSRRTAKSKAEAEMSVNAEQKPRTATRRTRATKVATAEKTEDAAQTVKATRTTKKATAKATEATKTATKASAKSATVKTETATATKAAAKSTSAATKAKTTASKTTKTAASKASKAAASTSKTAKADAATSDTAQSDEKRPTKRRTRKA